MHESSWPALDSMYPIELQLRCPLLNDYGQICLIVPIRWQTLFLCDHWNTVFNHTRHGVVAVAFVNFNQKSFLLVLFRLWSVLLGSEYANSPQACVSTIPVCLDNTKWHLCNISYSSSGSLLAKEVWDLASATADRPALPGVCVCDQILSQWKADCIKISLRLLTWRSDPPGATNGFVKTISNAPSPMLVQDRVEILPMCWSQSGALSKFLWLPKVAMEKSPVWRI